MIYYFILIFVKLNLLVFSIMKYSIICFYSLFDNFPHWAYNVLMLFFVLYYIYIDLKTATYIFTCVYIYKYWKSENNIRWAHTSVDPSMSSMDDASCQHLNHSSRAIISHTASMEQEYHLPICDLYHRLSIGTHSTM